MSLKIKCEHMELTDSIKAVVSDYIEKMMIIDPEFKHLHVDIIKEDTGYAVDLNMDTEVFHKVSAKAHNVNLEECIKEAFFHFEKVVEKKAAHQ
ncbi:methionine sulfoxide reductase [Photobacterium angustum]|uniref:Methionine sulfoxide reductase n=1 Tax=Photobacterium angustum TaxID=661 RepID=A0ABX5H1A5_PHOAN|nr:HPF/RaiA family ribosome-associated protein [Photobacterium angustum]KJG01095.1 methionine sulfoxide reductase [Photobacterium angustum]KJG16563.1 methionine sulfoxide reductase [Photobacterium angustum]KJG22794.1 methionine sulfoxide reductase [Photobacterium angustum]KJG29671.1 methionine sulfoxide reductase [Photobacterium angustum]KJG31254.1 methionine sulfoxide reductase [Photobacterium angustum]